MPPRRVRYEKSLCLATGHERLPETTHKDNKIVILATDTNLDSGRVGDVVSTDLRDCHYILSNI